MPNIYTYGPAASRSLADLIAASSTLLSYYTIYQCDNSKDAHLPALTQTIYNI